MGCIYLDQSLRPTLDGAIESLAQAITKNTRTDIVDRDVYALLPYVVAKLATRVTAIRFKSKPTSGQLLGVAGSIADAEQEFRKRLVTPALERDKNINGDVFGELA